MREYFRLVKLLKPYRGLLVLSFILIILFSVCNAISIYLSIPLLKTLFTSNDTQISTLGITTPGNFFDNMRHSFESYIFSGGDKYNALVKVCILLLIFYFLKNLFAYLQSILTQYVEKSLITDLRRKLRRG